jgi:hypothetical protein
LLAEVLISLIWFIFVLVQFNLELTKYKRHNGSFFWFSTEIERQEKV